MPVHPLPIRVFHWLNAFAMTCMATSGWAIYNASPLFGFTFPAWATLGGWLGGAVAWHFAAMWLLAGNGLFYLAYGLASGHFRRRFLPLSPSGIMTDLLAALKFRLPHEAGTYNAVQRLLYILVLLLGVLAVASGLAIWKPVQLWWLSAAFGDFATARYVHFLAMAGIVGFVAVHLILVVLVPRSLLPMLTGRHSSSHEVSS
ncbi:cytochrome b/b6 domain-containing protein [Telmatospirillum siberiense]|uniref:Thioredoxin reductase n=1 Tax=Telmatospirillum siberiense TaxID=382514 RepID=A0A2N3PZ73_9PROT|nr:cytochrome b/b6 domain-containing protein [Telmatospirillum siberiense]PKU25661.1 thioredoxin reductase [Telmatospirillum siberiense]